MNGDDVRQFMRRGRAAQTAVDDVIAHLPTVGDQPRRACPKPGARVIDKDAQRKIASQRAVRFRKAVLTRDHYRCRACGVAVIKTLELVPNRAEVHHRRGRNVRPEDRFNINAAVTLCATCHRNPSVIARFRHGDSARGED